MDVFFQTTGKKIRVKRTWLISLHELNLEYATDDNSSIDSGDDFRSGVTSGSKPYTGESKGSYCLSNICENQLIFRCIVQQEKKLPLSTISTFCLTVRGLFTRSSKFWEFFWLVDFLFAEFTRIFKLANACYFSTCLMSRCLVCHFSWSFCGAVFVILLWRSWFLTEPKLANGMNGNHQVLLSVCNFQYFTVYLSFLILLYLPISCCLGCFRVFAFICRWDLC